MFTATMKLESTDDIQSQGENGVSNVRLPSRRVVACYSINHVEKMPRQHANWQKVSTDYQFVSLKEITLGIIRMLKEDKGI